MSKSWEWAMRGQGRDRKGEGMDSEGMGMDKEGIGKG